MRRLPFSGSFGQGVVAAGCRDFKVHSISGIENSGVASDPGANYFEEKGWPTAQRVGDSVHDLRLCSGGRA